MYMRIHIMVNFVYSVVFGLFFVMNLILWGEGSSAAVPFTTLVALLALWFGVSVPLTFIGAYFGFRKRVSANLNSASVILLIRSLLINVKIFKR